MSVAAVEPSTSVRDATSLQQVLDSCKGNPSQLCVLHFGTEWAEPCQQMRDVLSALSTRFPHVAFWNLDAESIPQAAEQFQIKAVPTVILLRDGQQTERIDGIKLDELTEAITKQSGREENGTECAADDLNTRLAKLIHRHPFMIFIKGSPQAPRCGFTAQLINLLGDLNVSYDHFDILTDETVRQGLKTYSNWPTYPQIYIKGELVGGLDILKEMIESGQIHDLLA